MFARTVVTASWTLVGLAAAALALAWLVRRLSRPRTSCAGARGRGWRRILVPVNWLPSRRCGYDLCGLPAGPDGRIRCPECGRLGRPGVPQPVAGSRVRWLRVAAVFAVLGMAVRDAPQLWYGPWDTTSPTWFLVRVRLLLGEHTPRRVAGELRARFHDAAASGAPLEPFFPVLIADLADDRIGMNADAAMDDLRTAGRPARPALMAALDSPDAQTRQLAAMLLRGMLDPGPALPGPPEPAPPRLVRATLDGASPRRCASYTERCWERSIADEAAAYLHRNWPDVAPLLEDALDSAEPGRRLVAATLVAYRRETAWYPKAASVLVDHLVDNNVWWDARHAARALVAMGPAARHLVAPYAEDDDPQRARLARCVLWRYDGSDPTTRPANPWSFGIRELEGADAPWAGSEPTQVGGM